MSNHQKMETSIPHHNQIPVNNKLRRLKNREISSLTLKLKIKVTVTLFFNLTLGHVLIHTHTKYEGTGTFVIAIKNIASYILLSSHILSWLWANSLWNHIYCTCVMVCLLASMLDSFSFYHVMVCALIIRVHA
jgi:hypothetical protein